MTDFHLPAETHIGYAHLQVADLERALVFYRDLLGFRVLDQEGETVTLSADSTPHLLLTEHKGAIRQPRRSTGLYHVAIRLPNRIALARTILRLLQASYPLSGASDHLVSEALYLNDQDGNGLELYRDRPREQWPRKDDLVEMGSVALDLDDLLSEVAKDQSPWTGIDSGTDIGHVHVQVSDLAKAEAFYVNLLGFEVTQRNYPGALFVAAGGYHHHLGLNIWSSRGAPPAPSEAVGLLWFSLNIPSGEVWREAVMRLEKAGYKVELEAGNRARLHDGDGIGVVLTAE
jgi:catechol 2,3-dioxygenase